MLPETPAAFFALFCAASSVAFESITPSALNVETFVFVLLLLLDDVGTALTLNVDIGVEELFGKK